MTETTFRNAGASSRAFHLRSEMLKAQISSYEAECAEWSLENVHPGYMKHKNILITEERIKLIKDALKRDDLKIVGEPDQTLPTLVPNILKHFLPIERQGNWLQSMARELQEAGCRATCWERLSRNEMRRLIAAKNSFELSNQCVEPTSAFEKDMRAGIASRKAFQIRREQLASMLQQLKLRGGPYGITPCSDTTMIELVESALVRPDLKIPNPEMFKEMFLTQSKWLESLGQALKEAGCKTSTWDYLSPGDMRLLFAQSRALEVNFPNIKEESPPLAPKPKPKKGTMSKNTSLQDSGGRTKEGFNQTKCVKGRDAGAVLNAYMDELL
ncbi:hypothetical protein HDU97_007036 [Phlyctochytrium planicorne]|nr:hypothetical protein HDU97_007036 [Phlyctochytrium planicorne]